MLKVIIIIEVVKMENKKSNKGLVIFLIVLVVLLGTGLGLLLGGIVKNPFLKEKTCKNLI